MQQNLIGGFLHKTPNLKALIYITWDVWWAQEIVQLFLIRSTKFFSQLMPRKSQELISVRVLGTNFCCTLNANTWL
jgi:hypothetical protein